MSKEKVFAVFGLGTFGFELCREISKKGGKVIAIDKEIKLIERIKDQVMEAVQIDSSDEESLNKVSLDNIDVAVVAIGDNMQASMITVALLKRTGIPYIIARATSEIHSQLLKQIGANEIINLEIEEGKRLANKLLSPNVLEMIPISKNLIFAEVMVPESFIGKTLLQTDIRNKYNINVISIRRFIFKIDDIGNPTREESVLIAKPDFLLQSEDILAVVGNDNDIQALKDS